MERSPRLCRFEQTLGRSEVCQEARCPFWEPGGAVLQGRCAFDEVAFTEDADVARLMLHIRRLLEQAETREQEQHARRLLARLLNDGQGE
jgi:hypothetical protein